MFETIKGIIGDIAAGAIKDQRILLSQEQLTVLDTKLRDALEQVASFKQRVSELELAVADREKRIQELAGPPDQISSQDRPSPQHEILILLGKHPDAKTEDLSRHLQLSSEAISYHTEELKRLNLIHFDLQMYHRKSGWKLLHRGREYLLNRGLLQ